MSLEALFERFDIEKTSAADEPSSEWLAGQADGLARGRALAKAEETALHEQAAQALADLTLVFAEAQAHVLGRLTPLFSTICEQIVPHILRDTLGASLLDEFVAAARADAESPLALWLSPADAPKVRQVLSSIPGTKITLHEDVRLGPGQVFIEGEHGATALDPERIGRRVSEAMAALLDMADLSDRTEGQKSHG